MRRILIALALAAALPAVPAAADPTPVLETHSTMTQPPAANSATCVAVGAAPGVVTFAVYGTSGNAYTIAACVAYQNGVKIADFGGKRPGPVAAFAGLPRQVGAGRIFVVAKAS